MPKTKNTKQKKSALSKLANLSKRARLLIVIFSFILIGGIYFTYRSFAYDRLPLHFAATFFSFDAKQFPLGATEIEWTVKPLINEHRDGIYMANQWWFNASSDSKNPDSAPGYAGLQTSRCAIKQKCVTFSIWRANSGTAAIPGSMSRHFDHEGSGWQIIAPYQWVVNNEYRFKVQYIGTNGAGEDEWQASIRNAASAPNTAKVIGTIRTPGSWWGISKDLATFSEVFSSDGARSCNDIPYIGVEYKGYLMKSGNTVSAPLSQTVQYKGVGRETSTNCNFRTKISPIQFGVRHEMSGSIFNSNFTETTTRVIK